MVARTFLAKLIFLASQSHASKCHPYGDIGVAPGQGHSVQSYQEDYQSCVFSNRRVFKIRSFLLLGRLSTIIVDPDSMLTEIIDLQCLDQCVNLGPQEVANSRYGRWLNHSNRGPYPTQNDGITSSPSRGGEVALTIDMCPSSKGISRNVFRALQTVSQSENRPIPVGVAMTSRWIQRHPQLMEELKKSQRERQLQITWINHSSNHRYSRRVKVSENFLRLPGTDLREEVLGNERALIEAGVTPSIYFRFPGLVSSQSLVERITDFGLLILGTDAWLAKGEKPHSGSIILIHGNRNEPVGEERFIEYLSQMRKLGHRLSSLFDLLR